MFPLEKQFFMDYHQFAKIYKVFLLNSPESIMSKITEKVISTSNTSWTTLAASFRSPYDYLFLWNGWLTKSRQKHFGNLYLTH